jgi:hypothetical protein
VRVEVAARVPEVAGRLGWAPRCEPAALVVPAVARARPRPFGSISFVGDEVFLVAPLDGVVLLARLGGGGFLFIGFTALRCAAPAL